VPLTNSLYRYPKVRSLNAQPSQAKLKFVYGAGVEKLNYAKGNDSHEPISTSARQGFQTTSSACKTDPKAIASFFKALSHFRQAALANQLPTKTC
jgi:hypothetical protein